MSKKNDQRMQWILTLEDCAGVEDLKRFYYTEYEFCSEVRIPGVLDYENGAIRCHILEETDENDLFTYAVKVRHVSKEYKFDRSKYSKEGYFFEEGLIGELLVIFSVFFQARFFLKARTSAFQDDDFRMRTREDFRYRKPNRALHIEMLSPEEAKRNWGTGIADFLNDLRKIPPKYHQALIRAFDGYSKAIKEIGADAALFYIKMVSAIEPLLEESGPDKLEKKLRNLIGKGGALEEDREEITNYINNRKIKRKFIAFLSKYSEGFFKGFHRKAKHCYIRKPELGRYAGAIYNARSKYLHEGAPMFLSSDFNTEEAYPWDVDPSLEMMADRRRFSKNEKLPRMMWFERLVNYCLKRYLAELTW
ncbi:MAG TPA: hypothetical protein VN420_01270 [Candidatus Fimivivens sp.]|nr:hypothetical protein [Candidatus Fimivivens sp.]